MHGYGENGTGGGFAVVQRADIPVMALRVERHPDAIRSAWADLESRVGTFDGRIVFGAFYVPKSVYLACTRPEPDDEPGALGLEHEVLPGGRYLKARLHGEPPAVYGLIQPAFDDLAQGASVDCHRPGIEYYKTRGEIDLLLPVL